MSYGLMNIMVYGSIFLPFRNFLKKWGHKIPNTREHTYPLGFLGEFMSDVNFTHHTTDAKWIFGDKDGKKIAYFPIGDPDLSAMQPSSEFLQWLNEAGNKRFESL